MKQYLATLLLLVAIAPNNAFACLCRPGEWEQPLQKSSVAFVGQPISIDVVPPKQPNTTIWQEIRQRLSPLIGNPSSTSKSPPFPEFLGTVRVTFEVTQYLKGSGPKRLVIMTGYGDSDCGLPVTISKKYTIYAKRIDGSLRTSPCFGSADFVQRRNRPTCRGS